MWLDVDSVKKFLENIGDFGEDFLDDFLDGGLAVYSKIQKEDIFAHKGKFYYSTGQYYDIEEFEDQSRALKILVRIILADDFVSESFDTDFCLDRIRNKIYTYNSDYIYVNDSTILTNGYERASLKDLLWSLRDDYRNNGPEFLDDI